MEDSELEKIIIDKFQLMAIYDAEIYNKKYTTDSTASKNLMARAILYSTNRKILQDFIDSVFKDKGHSSTHQENEKIIEGLGSCISIYEADDAFWKLFWRGEIDQYNPAKMEFRPMGSREPILLNLHDVKEIVIGTLPDDPRLN